MPLNQAGLPASLGGAARRLYLLRHGEAAAYASHGHRGDPPQARLTPRGRAQIVDLAEALDGCGIDLLVTSAVPRALETAAILAGRIGVRPVVEEGLNELRSGEVLAGPPEQVGRTIRDAYREAGRPGARFLGGESFAGFARRIEQALSCVLARPGWTRAAVVTHEPALRYVLARCRGLGLDDLGEFEVSTGAVSILDSPAGAVSVNMATLRLVNGAPSDILRFG